MAQQPRRDRGGDRDRWSDDFRDFRSHNYDDSVDFGHRQGRYDDNGDDNGYRARGSSRDYDDSYREDYSQGGERRGSESYRGGSQWTDPSYRNDDNRGSSESGYRGRGNEQRGESRGRDRYEGSFDRNNDDTSWTDRDRYGGGMSRGGGYGPEASRHIANYGGGQGNYGTQYGGGQYGQGQQGGSRSQDSERAAANPGSSIWSEGRGMGGQSGSGQSGRGQYGQSQQAFGQQGYGQQGAGGMSGGYGQGLQGTDQGHRGRGPKNYSRSDDRIREDVCDHLTDHGWVDASEIEVTVKNGEVTLTGTVKDRVQRRHAEESAEAISGVSYVQNNLRVQSDTESDSSKSQSSNTAQQSKKSGTTGTSASTGKA